MSLTLKLGSLAIRTFAKPIANTIKRNAREHERFRKLCVSFAQSLHRIDMRLRLGLLQDPAVIEKQIAKEVADAEVRRKRMEAAKAVPTVKTKEQMEADAAADANFKKRAEEHSKAKTQPRIRPLSESKAIETGANFISESFMFMVAGSIIIFESWRSSRKESNRRADVAERLDALEKERDELRSRLDKLAGSSETSEPIKSVMAPETTTKAQIAKPKLEVRAEERQTKENQGTNATPPTKSTKSTTEDEKLNKPNR